MSYCTLDNINKDDEAAIYTNIKGEHVISGLKKNSKCYLYFDIKSAITVQELIASKNIDNSRSGAITGMFTEDTTGTIFSVADDDGISFVYAGNPIDNWVYFAGFYWRIIRINGDSSIRMIYSGDNESGPVEIGEPTQIGTSAYSSSYNDNAYIGYMYGSTRANTYGEAHANTNNSTIKGVLDTWYEENLQDRYKQYLSTEAGFCNDRKVYNSDSWNEYGTLGYGANATTYEPTGRFMQWSSGNNSWSTIQIPSLGCTNINDLYTVASASSGNNALDYPIGLITIDEVAYAGGFGGTANQIYYLYTGQVYWTMSPYIFNGITAAIFAMSPSGSIGHNAVSNIYGIRPVINLSSDVTLLGSGTSTDPYTVVGA